MPYLRYICCFKSIIKATKGFFCTPQIGPLGVSEEVAVHIAKGSESSLKLEKSVLVLSI